MTVVSEHWEERFTSSLAATGVQFWALVGVAVVGAIVVAVAFQSVPIALPIIVVAGVVGGVLFTRNIGRRVELVVTDRGVRYCNGLLRHDYGKDEISGVRLARDRATNIGSDRGVKLLTRGPTGGAPQEYGLGSVIWVSVALPLGERRRLVTALGRLLGDEAVAPLAAWVEDGDAADR